MFENLGVAISCFFIGLFTAFCWFIVFGALLYLVVWIWSEVIKEIKKIRKGNEGNPK